MKRPPALADVTGRERGSVGSRGREGDSHGEQESRRDVGAPLVGALLGSNHNEKGTVPFSDCFRAT